MRKQNRCVPEKKNSMRSIQMTSRDNEDVAEFCDDLRTMQVGNSSLICARPASIHL